MLLSRISYEKGTRPTFRTNFADTRLTTRRKNHYETDQILPAAQRFG